MTSMTLALRLGAGAAPSPAACQRRPCARRLAGRRSGHGRKHRRPAGTVKTAFASELAAAATTRRWISWGRAARRATACGAMSPPRRTAGRARAHLRVGRVRRRKASGEAPRRVEPGAHRLRGPALGRSTDPWAGLDKETLAKLASKSMDEIAVPREAKAGATLVAEATAPPGAWVRTPVTPFHERLFSGAIQVCAGIVTVSYHC